MSKRKAVGGIAGAPRAKRPMTQRTQAQRRESLRSLWLRQESRQGRHHPWNTAMPADVFEAMNAERELELEKKHTRKRQDLLEGQALDLQEYFEKHPVHVPEDQLKTIRRIGCLNVTSACKKLASKQRTKQLEFLLYGFVTKCAIDEVHRNAISCTTLGVRAGQLTLTIMPRKGGLRYFTGSNWFEFYEQASVKLLFKQYQHDVESERGKQQQAMKTVTNSFPTVLVRIIEEYVGLFIWDTSRPETFFACEAVVRFVRDPQKAEALCRWINSAKF